MTNVVKAVSRLTLLISLTLIFTVYHSYGFYSIEKSDLAEQFWTAYEFADCNEEKAFMDAYEALVSMKSEKNSDKVELAKSLMLDSCDECPDISFASLQGIAGYPQVEDLSLCGVADTVSLLMYNAGECPLSNLVLTVNFDSGLAYGGFVEEHTGKTVSEFDVSDASNPQFLITNIDSAEVFILNFGISADCDVDFNSTDPLNFDVTYDYLYENSASGSAACNGVEPEVGNFNNGIKVPVLNVLSITPVTNTITASNTDGCQQIVIRQDGLGAKLGDFNLDICGFSDEYVLSGFRSLSPDTDIPYTIDPVTGNVTGTIDATHISNIGNGDDIMDANESVTVEVCYQAEGCLDEPMFLEYKATYGCNGKKCGDPASIEGAVQFMPNYSATPVATSSNITYGGICGADLSYDISVTSANTDPLDGLWQDLMFKYPACLGNGLTVVDIIVNGTSLDASLYDATGSTLTLDFSTNTNPAYGFTDFDGDGMMNDLPGGQSVDITTIIDIGCSDSMSSCDGDLACSLSSIEVIGKRNCGQAFQQFATLTEPVDFFYGEVSSSDNTSIMGTFPIPLAEVFVTVDNVWLPGANGLEYGYEFGFENITPCANPGGIKLIASVVAAGNRINNIRYEEGSATYQGAAVPGTTSDYEIIDLGGGVTDTIGLNITIPIGDAAATQHDYYFNLEYRGDCFPDDYAYITYKVVEECNGCGDTDPCEIVRSCGNAANYVRWNGSDCPCIMEGTTGDYYRTNYGYADKEMTVKLTKDDVPRADQIRLLPGDTLFSSSEFTINDVEELKKADRSWLLRFFNHNQQAATPLIADINHSKFLGWFWVDGATGARTEIGVPDCMQNYTHATRDNYQYPSMWLRNMGVENFNTNYSNPDPYGPADNYGICTNNGNINPNYPEDVVMYEIADLSSTDAHADQQRIQIYWQLPESCPLTATYQTDGASADHVNPCFEEFWEQFPMKNGDKIVVEMESPMIHNPAYDLQAINGTSFPGNPNLTLSFIGYSTDEATCGSVTIFNSCNDSAPLQQHIPGPVSVSNDVVVEDCDTEVSYEFTLQNPVPSDLADGELPWFENEYRPYFATEYLQFEFPNNMVYLGDGVIVMPDGSEVPFPSEYIQDSEGNLACVDDGAGGVCCVAANTDTLAAMKLVDEQYLEGVSTAYGYGPNGPNESADYCDIPVLIHQKGDPFPHLMVGGTETCTYGVRYNLASLCPEEISSTDFRLEYQFAEPYIPTLAYQRINAYHGAQSSATRDYTNTSYYYMFPDNPFGESCSAVAGEGCTYYFQKITTDPVASNHTVNPMRQGGYLITSADNFTDNSMNLPTLVPTASAIQLLIADLADMQETNTYEVCAPDNGVDMGSHMNVATTITVPLSIDLLGVEDENGTAQTFTLVSTTATHRSYTVSNPDLAPGECFTMNILTELLFCPVGLDVDTEICLTTTSGCIDGEKAASLAAAGGGACESVGLCYMYIAEEADLQAEWQPDALGEVPLCSVIEMNTVVKNVKPANLIDLETQWWFPAGLDFIPGSWQVCYPGGPNVTGPCVSVLDPTGDPSQNSAYGTYFEYLDDQIWSSQLAGDPINTGGLPGSLSMQDSNFVKFVFEVETVCDEFISGTSIWFQADAADPCEQRVESMFVPSPPIIVEGANPADFAQFFVFADPVEASCGTESEIVLTYLNTSPVGVTNNSMVCMDIETTTFAYMPGSVYMVSPASYTPTFTESTNGSITHICFDIPDGIGPGQVFQTGFSFMVPEDLACGEQDLGVQVSSELMSQNCMAQGIECSVGVLNSVNPIINIDFLPPVTVESQELRLGCSTTGGMVEACYDVELVNNGATYSNDVNIVLIYDVDQNGQIDDYDTKLDSMMTPVIMPAGDTLMLSGCIEIPADQACPIFLMVMQETNCVCDAQDFYYDSLQPDLGLDGQVAFGVCPGEPFGMQYCGDLTYTLEPSGGGTITTTADSLFVELAAGESGVTLNVTGDVGQCEPFDYDVTINSLMDFELGPFSTIDVCSDACQVLNAGIPIEYQPNVTVEWIPSTYLDDPTSMTPKACNVEEDITYTIIATFTSGDAMCLFNADVPLLVTDPVTVDLFEESFICETDATPLEAPAGKDNYFWFLVNDDGTSSIAAAGASFSPEAPGTYYLECSSSDDVCSTYSNEFVVKPCVDLALVKSVNPLTPGPYSNGSSVIYDLTVYNQSLDVDVFNVTVSDYFPECLVLNDAAWTEATAATATMNGVATINNPIALIPANGFQTVTIEFTISTSCTGSPITNDAEITGYDDDNDPMTPPAPDEDSTPGDDAGNPSETGTDGEIDDDNPNFPGTDDDPTDSDDFDPESIEFSPCESIGGEVFIDMNNNGCEDAEDVDGVAFVDVTIWACDPATGLPSMVVGNTVTGSDGSWTFGGVDPVTGMCALDPDVTYTASFDIPNMAGEVAGDPYLDYEFSTGEADPSCTDGEDDNVDPDTGIAEGCFDPTDDDGTDGDGDNNIDAAITPPCQSIGGEVFVDTNNDGCQDATETTMVPGVEVTIWSCDPATGEPSAVVGMTTTGVDGTWSFGDRDPVTGECILDPSMTYTASFDIPNEAGDLPGDPFMGYEFTEGEDDGTCADGEADDVDPDTGIAESCYDPNDMDAGDGDDDNDIDAGISAPCESIGGEVFVDANNNGCQDADETMMVEGVEVTIWSCDPITGAPSVAVGSTTTGMDGTWTFGGMDPATGECALDPDQTYTVSFDLPNTTGDLPGDPFVGFNFSTGEAEATCTDGEEDDVDSGTGVAETCYDPTNDDGDDGDDDNDIDAGIYPCETMGGEVFVDINNNGCQDASEMMMVEGVEVSIWTCDPVTGDPDNVVGVVTTGTDGQWSFGGADPDTGECLLDPSQTYTVSFDIPTDPGDLPGDPYVGYDFTEGMMATDCLDGEADDVDPDTGIAESCYNPDNEDDDDGDDDENIDAAITPPCESIGGEVFVDINNNGCQDAGETTMVEGVEVTIWACDPATGEPSTVVGMATTGSDGVWMFGGMNPTTGICELDPDVTYTASFDLPNEAGDLPGDPYLGYEFTEGEDACADGESDDVAPDTGIANDCYDPSDDDGTDGDDDNDIDAGITPPCQSIGGEVFVDENNNGCQDADETDGVEGAEVTIWSCDPVTGDPDNVIGTATTGPDGTWTFGGMDPATGECFLDPNATYTASFDLPNAAGDVVGDPYLGYNFSTGEADALCADGESDDVDSGTGIAESCYDPNDDDANDGDDDNDIDAGISPCETMGGEVFVDINNNGCQDAVETMMVEGAEVTIWSCDPITGDPVAAIGMATTGPDGSWSFGGANPDTGDCLLDPTQTYTVSFDMPTGPGEAFEGYGLTEGEAGMDCADGASDDVNSDTGIAEDCYNPDNEDDEDGDDDESIDAAITPPCESIGGEVFVDINNNGCQDDAETTMVEGVEVTIWACDPATGEPSTVVGMATTGSDGVWMFGGMNPTTGICELDPDVTYTVSFDIPNEAGDLPGDPYLEFDFTEGEAMASCADGEADDVNSDTGIANDCYDPSDDDGTDGDDDNDIDAGITPPCESIGGEVYVDENNNGCQDADETTMVEGVEVTIWACDPITGQPSTPVGTAVTGADGMWMFGSMDPATGVCQLDPDATYTVSFDLPNAAGDIAGDPYVGLNFSTEEADATCTDGEADDVDPGTGVANDCYDPNDDDGTDGDDDNDIDAGISPCESMGGTVFIDMNNNGCQEATETMAAPGIEVTIWSCDPVTGTPVTAVGMATTGPDGSWDFSGADPDTGDCLLDPNQTYTVSFDLPNGPGEAYEGYMFSSDDMTACANDADADDVDPSTGLSDCYNPDDEDGEDGDSDEDIDAGIFPCQMLGGTVFYDMNLNGCQDADETPVMHPVGVMLFECGQDPDVDLPLATTTTINGEYNFGMGSPNENADVCLEEQLSYFVVFDIPDGPGEDYENYVFTNGEETCDLPADADDVDPETGESECYGPGDADGDDDDNIDAGIFGCENLEGVVFYDNDNNGCQEGTESVVTIPVMVSLYECGQVPGTDAPLRETMTIDGEYEFGLDSNNPGADICLEPTKTYFVVFDLPNDTQADPLSGFEFSTNSESCAIPGIDDDVDPANGQTPCFNPDGDDPGDGNGDEHVDAGIYPCQDLGGDIFYDISNNGCQETGENFVLESVEVQLFECGQDPLTDMPVATTMTVDGEYEFGQDAPNAEGQACLEPGTLYFVYFDIPNGAGEALQGYGISTNENFCVGEGTSDDFDPETGQSECYDPFDDDDEDGEEDDHIDAGIFECEDLGGTVFYDMNNNGCQDAGETPVTEEVGVTLFECSAGAPGGGIPLATTTTINGEYEFGAFSPNPGGMYCLEPGKQYYVEFDIPNGPGEDLEDWNLSSHADACANPEDSDDVDPSNGQSGCYDPEDAGEDPDGDGDNDDGDADNDIDAGVYPCQTVGGEIFVDENNNGCQDPTESLVMESVDVMLFECGQDPSIDAPIASTSTSGGAYEFGPESPNPGGEVCIDPYFTYFVVFDIPAGPLDDFHPSTGDSAGCEGTADSTDADPGTLQSECYDPSDPDSDDDGDDDIDLGVSPCQELGGEIFLDENNNGCQDPSESLITEDVTVTLYTCTDGNPENGTVVASTTTNTGMYEFGPNSPNAGADVCLEIGTQYYVGFEFDNGPGAPLQGHNFSSGEDMCGNSSDADDIDRDTGFSGCYDPENDDDDDDIDAGINPCQEMGGTVFYDNDGNGCQDGTETPVSEEVTVSLFECSGATPGGGTLLATTTTINGEYVFSEDSPNPNAQVCLEADKFYYVQFNIAGNPALDNFALTLGNDACANPADADDTDPATGESGCFNPDDNDDDDGDSDNDVDAGIIPLAKVGNFVFNDCDGNGLQGPGEEGIPYLQVNLYASNGVLVNTTVTDVNGEYLFEHILPGDYYIEILTPDGFDFTLPNMGANEANDSDVTGNNGTGTTNIFNLSPGECDLDSGDAGLYECVSIGERVWFDTNQNNVWDATENGVNGLRVVLFRQMGDGSFVEWDEQYTGHKPGTPSDDGYFKFCAPPGTYYVEFNQPPYGMVAALPNIGSFDSIDSDVTGANGPGTTSTFSVSCTEENCNIGAGYYPMGTLGDFVWFDNNQNGMREPGEPGVGQVAVTAYNQAGDMVASTMTDASGNYMLDYLQAEDVFLRFDPPAGFAATIAGMTTEDMDSDIDNSNGPMTTKFYEVSPGEHTPNVDAGLIQGVVAVDWVDFVGENRDKHNWLEWKVTNELNVSHYEIERVIDQSGEFENIGRVLSFGDSYEVVTYEFLDYDVEQAGLYYYRIKQLDLDGTYSYSDIITIEIEALVSQQNVSARVYPNPLVDELTLELQVEGLGLGLEYEIVNAEGKLVRKLTELDRNISEGRHIFVIDVSEFTPGIYTLRLKGAPSIINKKLIIVSN